MGSISRLDPELKQLSELRGLPGQEDEVRDWLRWRLEAASLSPFTDSMGNLIVPYPGGETYRSRDRSHAIDSDSVFRPGSSSIPNIMLAAHMDEVGLVVSGVDESGLLRFQTLGGIDERVLAAKPVLVGPHGLPGLISMRPFHLQKKSEREQTISLHDLYIDIGARNRDDALRWVQPGDGVTFATTCEPFGHGYAKGKAFDDRAGCYLLYRLLTSGIDVPFTAVFTVQEEVGLRGAGTATERIRPDLAIVLEATTCADIPGTPEHAQVTRLGGGPAFTRSDSGAIADPAWTERLIRVADTHHIPWQWKRTHLGGNDAGRIHVTAGGIPSISISLPCRYIHSPVSVLSLTDLEHAFKLLRLFLVDVVEGGRIR